MKRQSSLQPVLLVSLTLGLLLAVAADGLAQGVEYFEWTPISSPQGLNQPIPVTVTARKDEGRTATTFTNNVTLSGLVGGTSMIWLREGRVAINYPARNFHRNMRTQVLYLNSEVGLSTSFNRLDLEFATVPSHPLADFRIRMKNVPASMTNLDTNEWQDSGWSTVYQKAAVSIVSTGWYSFVFSSSFAHAYPNNLMVDFSYDDTTRGAGSTDGRCLGSEMSEYRVLWYESDDPDEDPLDWSGSTPAPRQETVVPNIRLTRPQNSVQITPTTAGPFTAGKWTGTVTVTESSPVLLMRLRADDGQGHTGESELFSTEERGQVQVFLLPTNAPTPPNPAWRLTSGYDTDWHAGGETVSGVATGVYTVTFADVFGWSAPADISVTVLKDQLTQATATYTAHTGTLSIEVTPDEGVWVLTQYPGSYAGPTGGTGDLAATTVAVGTYTVDYQDIGGYSAPADQTQDVLRDLSTVFQGEYSQFQGTISIDVTPDTASWQMTAYPAGYAGATAGTGDLGVTAAAGGTYTVTYQPLAGYITPAPETLGIINGSNTAFTGTYVSTGTVPCGTITIDVTPDTGAWTVTQLPTVDVSVSASTDDAEEEVTSGGVETDSSDLELVEESDVQLVGMRFNGITVPPGATISSAYIQFRSDEVHSGATTLSIQGEAADNPGTFSSNVVNDVSSRARTTASVSWSPPAWSSAGQAGSAQRTPDLASVIQEIVDRPGWASGNSLIIIVTGSGKRVADSFDGGWGPQLHIEYPLTDPYTYNYPASGAGDLGATVAPIGNYQVTYTPVTGYNTPADQTLAVTQGANTAFAGTWTRESGWIAIDVTPAAGTWTLVTYPADYAGPTSGTDDLAATVAPAGSYRVTYGSISGYAAPAAETKDVTNGATTTFIGTYTQGFLFEEDFEPYAVGIDIDGDNGWVASPANMATVQTGVVHGDAQALDLGATATLTRPFLTGSGSLDVRVASSTDDAEERLDSNAVETWSGDLELVEEAATQTVGMRFAGIAIPPGATISSAYIQFTVDETTNVATALTIQGEDAADATTFSSNIVADISSRPLTTASVAWAPPAWSTAGQAGAAQRTPDISAVIKEIVDRGDWSSGNALAIIINGSGKRTAEAWDGEAPKAPLLHIDWTTPTPNPPDAIWTEMWIQPVFRVEPLNPGAPSSGTTAAFFVKQNGHVVYFDGAGGWAESSAVTLTEGQWVSVLVGQDYAAKTWSLQINGSWIATDVAFVDAAVSSITQFGVVGGLRSRTYLDDIRIAESPSDIGTLPFAEDFEARNPGTISGQGGWVATPSTEAVVQGAVVHGGSQALELGDAVVSHGFLASSAHGVGTDLWLRPTKRLSSMPPTLNASTTVALYVDKDGYLTAYDGGVGWQTLSHTPIADDTWVRLTIHQNYDDETWSVELGGTVLATGLGFASSQATFTALTLTGGALQLGYVDDIAIAEEAIRYPITASAEGAGAVSPSGITEVDAGANQAFTMNPDPGAQVWQVEVDGVNVGATSTYTFTNVTTAHTIHARFVGTSTHTITASAGAHGSIVPPGNVTVWDDADQSFLIIAESGYTIDDVTVNGSSVGAVGRYTFTNVTANQTISATFARFAGYRDFDGDGKTDVWFYDPATGTWYVKRSSTGDIDVWHFGFYGPTPVPADYDGDSLTDLALYDQPQGVWYLMQTSAGFLSRQFGWSAAAPVPADYDGDRKADLAVYGPGGYWYMLRSTAGFGMTQFGWDGPTPVPGDYDGDFQADLGVYHGPNGGWYLLKTAEGFAFQQFGWSGPTPVPADYDGDGKADLALYNQPSGTWYLLMTSDGFRIQNFGWAAAEPMPGDYDGDKKTDLCVRAAGTWYILGTSDGFWTEQLGW
ncbi:MAG: VCBS repeat-containing protein [Kiritimatiellae bacterium]|nr:VCBS repeat-containing protein [Kiritimatiellia bacterium]